MILTNNTHTYVLYITYVHTYICIYIELNYVCTMYLVKHNCKFKGENQLKIYVRIIYVYRKYIICKIVSF